MRHIYRHLVLIALAIIVLPAIADTFREDLKRVDNSLKTNPSQVLWQSLEACLRQWTYAIELMDMGMPVRAQRALQYCFDSLQISRDHAQKVSVPSR